MRETILKRYRTELQAIPGAAEVLAAVTLPKCVASSSDPSKLALGLIDTGLYDLVYPHIFSAALVDRGKPHPDIFLYAAERMAISPRDCLVIEDSVAGATAARAAEMRCVGFTGGSHCGPGHADRLLDAGVSRVIARLEDLLDELG
ncbi:MAG: HAD-IA family hydrolase [Pseudomonadota bacterium]